MIPVSLARVSWFELMKLPWHAWWVGENALGIKHHHLPDDDQRTAALRNQWGGSAPPAIGTNRHKGNNYRNIK